MPRKQLTQQQKEAFNFVRTAGWLAEDQAVGCALLRYLTEERERSGLTIKEVADKAYRLQEEGYLPQRPGKKGYKPPRKPHKQTTRETPVKVQKT
jgi:hypothetical protein